MEDLFKQFRENLENRPEPAFEERDWQDMQARLERDGNKRPVVFGSWWFALPFALLLSGGNIFFFWQWKAAERKIVQIEIRHDTIFHTRVIHTSDTVFRTRVLRERVLDYQASIADPGMALPTKTGYESSQPSETGTAQSPPILRQYPDDVRSAQDGWANLPPNGEKIENGRPKVLNTTILPIETIQALRFKHRYQKRAESIVFIPAKRQKKALLTRIYEARPISFQLGVSGGWVYPVGKSLDYQSGSSAAVQAAVEFSHRIRLWADVSYSKTYFLTDRMGNDLGVPVVEPPSDEYVFSRAEVPQPLWQYSAGLQYLFRPTQRLKPFVGLGYGMVSLLSYDVTYEFKHPGLGVEWDYDKTENGQGLMANFGLLHAGLEYQVSKKWNAQIRANYRAEFGKTSSLKPPDVLGIGGALNYRF